MHIVALDDCSTVTDHTQCQDMYTTANHERTNDAHNRNMKFHIKEFKDILAAVYVLYTHL